MGYYLIRHFRSSCRMIVHRCAPGTPRRCTPAASSTWCGWTRHCCCRCCFSAAGPGAAGRRVASAGDAVLFVRGVQLLHGLAAVPVLPFVRAVAAAGPAGPPGRPRLWPGGVGPGRAMLPGMLLAVILVLPVIVSSTTATLSSLWPTRTRSALSRWNWLTACFSGGIPPPAPPTACRICISAARRCCWRCAISSAGDSTRAKFAAAALAAGGWRPATCWNCPASSWQNGDDLAVFPFRYGFLLSAMLVIFAADTLVHAPPPTPALGAALFLAAIYLLGYQGTVGSAARTWRLAAAAALYLGCCVLLRLRAKPGWQRRAAVLLALCCWPTWWPAAVSHCMGDFYGCEQKRSKVRGGRPARGRAASPGAFAGDRRGAHAAGKRRRGVSASSRRCRSWPKAWHRRVQRLCAGKRHLCLVPRPQRDPPRACHRHPSGPGGGGERAFA